MCEVVHTSPALCWHRLAQRKVEAAVTSATMTKQLATASIQHDSLRPSDFAFKAAIVFLLVVTFCGLALADDREVCPKSASDDAVAACTRVITSGAFHGRDLAEHYVQRGNVFVRRR